MRQLTNIQSRPTPASPPHSSPSPATVGPASLSLHRPYSQSILHSQPPPPTGTSLASPPVTLPGSLGTSPSGLLALSQTRSCLRAFAPAVSCAWNTFPPDTETKPIPQVTHPEGSEPRFKPRLYCLREDKTHTAESLVRETRHCVTLGGLLNIAEPLLPHL
jgi:hypothetical protein